MFDAQFTYSTDPLCHQDTNSLLKLALTKRKRSEKDDKTHSVDKVVMSNSVHCFLFNLLLIYKWRQSGSGAEETV